MARAGAPAARCLSGRAGGRAGAQAWCHAASGRGARRLRQALRPVVWARGAPGSTWGRAPYPARTPYSAFLTLTLPHPSTDPAKAPCGPPGAPGGPERSVGRGAKPTCSEAVRFSAALAPPGRWPRGTRPAPQLGPLRALRDNAVGQPTLVRPCVSMGHGGGLLPFPPGRRPRGGLDKGLQHGAACPQASAFMRGSIPVFSCFFLFFRTRARGKAGKPLFMRVPGRFLSYPNPAFFRAIPDIFRAIPDIFRSKPTILT